MSVGAPTDFRAPDPDVGEAPHRRPRSPYRWRLVALVLIPILAVVVLVATRPWGSAPQPVASTQRAFTLAWVVDHTSDVFLSGSQTYLTIVAAAPGERPIAVVIPGATIVDIPGGGPPTVGEAITEPAMVVAVAQATIDHRVEHHLLSTEADVMDLVDRLGGIEVQVDEPFLSGGGTLGPGATHMYGADVLAYLENVVVDPLLAGTEEELAAAEAEDSLSRWQSVLWGLFSATAEPELWEGTVGESDAASPASLLEQGRSAVVTELPTVPGEDGQLLPDIEGVTNLVANSFPEADPLIRVVVLNGNGQAGQGVEIGLILAPHGFRVVSAQNAASFRVQSTAILASSEDFLDTANQVRALLGVGRVYVGPQPTGVAEITIVAGKDFITE